MAGSEVMAGVEAFVSDNVLGSMVEQSFAEWASGVVEDLLPMAEAIAGNEAAGRRLLNEHVENAMRRLRG